MNMQYQQDPNYLSNGETYDNVMISSNPTGFLIKLYILNDGAWSDQGTGYVQCVYETDKLKDNGNHSEVSAPALVVMKDECPNLELLCTRIQLEDIYERQGGRFLLIQWIMNYF